MKDFSEYDFKACKNLCKYTWIKEADQGYIWKREKKREILISLFMTSLSSLEAGIRLHFLSADLKTKGWVLWGWEMHSIHNLFFIH